MSMNNDIVGPDTAKILKQNPSTKLQPAELLI